MSLSTQITEYFARLDTSGRGAEIHRSNGLDTLREEPDFQTFLASMQKLDTEKCLLVVLRALAAQKTSFAPRLIDANLVVTSPGAAGINARHTIQVVRQIISGAKNELLIAGYAVTEAGGVLSQLVDAARRGVGLIFLCSDWKKDAAAKTADELLLESWPADLPVPKVYSYRNAHEQTAGMHMKCLLADAEEILVGSANFTFPGLNTNFEMGIRIRGHVAAAAREVMFEMLRTGRFTEVLARQEASS